MIKNENQLRELLGSVEMKKCVKTLVVSEWCGNGIKDDLNLCGFDNLESLVVKKCSLRYLNSLKVSDNDKLNSIEIEDGERDDEKKTVWGAFDGVKSVVLSSMMIYD